MSCTELFEFIRMRKEPLDFEFTNPDGSPVDLTGKSVRFVVKRLNDNADNDDNAMIKRTITEHTDPVGGKTGFVPTDDEDKIPIAVYKADVWVFDESGLSLSSNTFNFSVIDSVGKEKGDE